MKGTRHERDFAGKGRGPPADVESVDPLTEAQSVQSSELAPEGVRRPLSSGAPREVVRGRDARTGEPTIELVAPRARIVGPGRQERSYLARIAELRTELDLENLVGRGTRRRAERVERVLTDTERERARLAAEAAERAQTERRLLVLVGALQSENAALRAQLERAAPKPALAPPARRPFLARLFGKR